MKPKEVAKLIDEGTVARRPGEKLARLKVPILRRCVVLCARPVEMNAIVKHLTKRAVHKTRVGAQLERGVFVGANEKWDVFVGETGQGNPAAAAYGTAAVMELRPDLFLFIGVAGGLKDVELGDIVVASEVFGYERGKVVKGGIKPRPTIARAPFRLAELAREIARSTDWHARLSKANKPGRKRGGAAVYVEPIVAGEKIVADNRSAVAAFLRKHFSHAYAVEMEAAGFSEAAHVTEARALIVRGISDLIDEKESSDAAGWQGVASARAAAFGFHLLSELDQKPRSSSKRASAKRKQ